MLAVPSTTPTLEQMAVGINQPIQTGLYTGTGGGLNVRQPQADPKWAALWQQRNAPGGTQAIQAYRDQSEANAKINGHQDIGGRTAAGVAADNATGGGFGSGGIGSNPFGGGLGANTMMQPRSVQTQIANRPAYQRNRVTTGQMGEMNRANQDRFRAEQRPLTTAFNRSFSQADAQQRMADTSVNDSMANQFFGLMNGYQQQQNSLNQQQIMPLLSQLFGGF